MKSLFRYVYQTITVACSEFCLTHMKIEIIGKRVYIKIFEKY